MMMKSSLNKLIPLLSLGMIVVLIVLIHRVAQTTPSHPRSMDPYMSKPFIQSTRNDILTYDTTAPPPLALNTQVLPTFYPSKELFVRAIYFDGRATKNQQHQNSSVFLIVVKKSITDHKLIVGCQIDNKIARDFEVRLIGETPLWRIFYPKINHEEAFVECFDMPAKNGSTGYIHFKRDDENSPIELAASERPLLIPQHRVEPSTPEAKKYGFTIAACAKIFGSKPPWLEEWLLYQRALGIQHVHLDAEDSFKLSGGLDKPFIKKAMQEGFLSVDVWNKYLSPHELWYHNQGLIYEDCVYRLQGVYDYLVLMDTDDFLTPRIPTEKQLYYYINKYCRGETTGSCRFKWIEYYPDQFGLNHSIPIPNGNLTSQLKNYTHYIQGNPKSLHRANVIIDAATHYAHKMLDGYKTNHVSLDVMYAAHIRKANTLRTGADLHSGPPHANGSWEHTVNVFLLVFNLIFCLFT